MKPIAAIAALCALCAQVGRTWAEICGDPRAAVPFLRSDFSSPDVDHYYTTNSTDMQQSIGYGYIAKPLAGYIFQTSQPGTVPLRRLFSYSRGNHWYTVSPSERNNAVENLGYLDEAIAGYVYPNATCGGLPLYSAYNSQLYAHLYTISQEERDDATRNLGYADSGIAAYILPP